MIESTVFVQIWWITAGGWSCMGEVKRWHLSEEVGES
jgi:hypothetical protein